MTKKPVHIDITLKSGAWIDPPKFFQQIADAGYAARKEDVRITLTGKIVKEGEKLLLIVADIKPEPQKFWLLEGKSKDEKEAKALGEAFAQAQQQVEQTVELEGRWKAADKKDTGAFPSLTVLRVVKSKE